MKLNSRRVEVGGLIGVKPGLNTSLISMNMLLHFRVVTHKPVIYSYIDSISSLYTVFHGLLQTSLFSYGVISLNGLLNIHHAASSYNPSSLHTCM